MAILLIHTGGTIGMAQTSKGFAPKAHVVETAIQTLRDQRELTAEVDILALRPLIDSANATPEDWNRIAAAIADNHDRYDGFVVTHGTDTMAFTAAALCFALEGLARPVILTGSMLPLTAAGSDGLRNLSDSLDAAQVVPAGVWVQFAGQRMHGARVRKVHSSDADAFRAAYEPVMPRVPGKVLTRHAYSQHELAALSMAPGVSQKVIAQVLAVCDGVVLRVFGSGTVPDSPMLRAALEQAQARGALIIAVSQATKGRINFGTYAAGAMLTETGVIEGRDMTVEAAYAKLAHVLSRTSDPDRRRALMATLLCGEAGA